MSGSAATIGRTMRTSLQTACILVVPTLVAATAGGCGSPAREQGMSSGVSANTTVASASDEVSRVDFGPFDDVPMAIPLQLSFREPEPEQPFAPVLEYDASQTAPRA